MSTNTHIVRIPEELNKKEYIKAVGLGLYLMIGENFLPPANFESENCAARINISDKAQECLNTLLKRDEFNSKKEVFKTALSCVADCPKWMRDTTII